MKLISLQVGTPQTRTSAVADGLESRWTSAIFKHPVSHRVGLNITNLDGDAQADLKNHGGPDKAVCCYAAEHYESWRLALGLSDTQFPYGAFGENFTLSQMPENSVCLGDLFQIGTAQVLISQPRMPCYKLGRRWERPKLPHAVQTTGKTGYYLRVIQTGEVGSGDTLVLLERPAPEWTIARINQAMYLEKDNAALAAALARHPLLAEAWRGYFRQRASAQQENMED